MTQRLTDTSPIDRQFFAANPEAECYVRRMAPGEFPSYGLNGEKHVLVTRVANDIRQKHPLRLYCEHAGIPSRIMWVDTGEMWQVRETGEIVPDGETCREIWQALLPDETRALVEVGRTMDGGAK